MAQNETATENKAVIITKLLVPALPEPLVIRSRLTDALNRAYTRSRLILVSAQAGSGKTTAVLEWLQQADPVLVGKIAWVSLDDNDNEAVRFWSYVCHALENALPTLGNKLSALFYLSQQPTIERILTDLINELVNLDRPVTLVLDDFHLVTAPEILQQVAFLLDRLPSPLRMVLTSRVDPALPLPRLRLRRQLAEIRATDLRFTADEAGAFLNAVSGQALSPQNIADLESKTEGWGAALQLAALLLQGHHDIDKFIRNFSSNQRFMLDYLAEEVLQRQSEKVQHFLLQTSILEQLSASLVEAVTSCEDGQAMLQNLLTANLFLIPLDDEREWYRYHHLFQEYLLKRLVHTQSEHIPLLHNWAAHWFEEHALPLQAIEHALKAQDFLYAADLIDKNTADMYSRHQLQTLWRWLQNLPISIIEQRPHTGLDCAWTLILQNRHEAAIPYIQMVQSLLEKTDIVTKILPPDLQALQAEVTAAWAFVERKHSHFDQSIVLSNQALELINPSWSFLRCAVMINLAQCFVAIDKLAAAVEEYARVETLARSYGDKYFMLMGLLGQATLQAQQGQLHAAQTTCYRAIASKEVEHLPVLGLAYTILGSLSREWNDLITAQQHLDKAARLFETGGELNPVNIYSEVARVHQAQGDLAAAHQELEQVEKLLFNLELEQPLWSHQLKQARVRLWLAQGELGQAESWAAALQLENQITPQFLRETDYLLLARLRLTKQPKEAYRLASEVVTIAGQVGRLPTQIEGLLLQCQALYTQKQHESALKILEQALQLAQPESFMRLFIDEGPNMQTMLATLHDVKANTSLTEYLLRLLAAAGSKSSAVALPTIYNAAPTVAPQSSKTSKRSLESLSEPLTEREQEVLHLLATTALDSTEIADALAIAISTLRTHIKNIYAKLEVQNRFQAISRARELGLVSV